MAYTANGMSTDGHVSHQTWSVVINELIHRFLTEIVFQEAIYLVAGVFQQLGKDKLELEFQITKGTRKSCHVFTIIEKDNHCVCELKPPIRKEILEEL